MNPDKICQRFHDGKGSDMELILIDDNNTIKLDLHKFVLINSCDFFETLILFPNNIDKKFFTLQIFNAIIVRDIIALFYGVNENSTDCSEWSYILGTLLCKNYLCLPIDITKLYNLRVPEIGFNLFMQVTELFGDVTSDYKLMRSVKRNLPLNYDLTIFSEEFLEELFKKNRLIVSGSSDSSICIWDSKTGDCLKTLSGHSGSINTIAFSQDDNLIVSDLYFI